MRLNKPMRGVLRVLVANRPVEMRVGRITMGTKSTWETTVAGSNLPGTQAISLNTSRRPNPMWKGLNRGGS
jgi:hypothetical protein